MSREIKFRAWDNACGYWSMSEAYPTSTGIMVYKKSIGDSRGQSEYLNNPELYNLMQYTGLKDKNGVEIYEGDIVRSFNDYWDGCKHLDLICRYDEPEWIFGDHPWCEVGSEKCEVIGNIYENPELLERGKGYE